VVWCHGNKFFKKWYDLVPINATVTNSGKISQQENIITILVFILPASRLNYNVYLFHRGCHVHYSVIILLGDP